MFSQFQWYFRSRCAVCLYAIRFHIEVHCFTLNQLHASALPSDVISPSRACGSRSRLRSRVSSVLLREPPRIRVRTNEPGEIRDLNLGNWNVQIKLRGGPRPSWPPIYRSALPPLLYLPSRAAIATVIPFARNRDKRFRTL